MSVSKQQGILTAQVKPQQANTSAAGFQNQLADFAFATAEVLADKANKKHEMDFRNQAQDGINKAYERNQSNPQQLQKELQSLRGGLVKNTPRNLRDTFDSSFSQLSQPFLNKATSNHGRVLTSELKASSLQNLEHGRIAMSSVAADFLSNDPVAVADATQAAQAKITEMSNTLSETDLTGQPVFNGNERFSLMKKFIDETSFSAIRSAYDDSIDKEDFLERFESGEMKASIFIDDKGNFVENSIDKTMDRASFERTRNYMESDIKSLKLEAKKANARYKKLFTEDPAQLAIESGALANDIEGVIEMQRNLGVAEGNISVIPKEQAAFTVNQMNGIIDSDTMINALAEIEQIYGSENYSLAMKDIKKAGLSDQHAFIAMMNPKEDKQLMDAAFVMGVEGADIRKKATMKQGITVSKIEERIAENIADSMEAIALENPAGEAQTAVMQANMVDMALYFTSQGQNIDAATVLATEWMNNKTPLGDVNGKKFRVAEGFTADELEPALEQALQEKVFIGTAFENNVIKREARFVLHPDGDKYYIKNGINTVVQDESGVVYFPIFDVLEAKQQQQQKRREAVTQQQLEKLQGRD